MAEKPKAHTSLAEKELDKAEKQFDAFDQNIKDVRSRATKGCGYLSKAS